MQQGTHERLVAHVRRGCAGTRPPRQQTKEASAVGALARLRSPAVRMEVVLQRDAASDGVAGHGDEDGERKSLSRSASGASMGSRKPSLASFAAVLDGTDEAPRATLVRQALAAFIRGATTVCCHLAPGSLALAC